MNEARSIRSHDYATTGINIPASLTPSSGRRHQFLDVAERDHEVRHGGVRTTVAELDGDAADEAERGLHDAWAEARATYAQPLQL